MSAEAEPDDLYPDGRRVAAASSATASRLMEMRSEAYLARAAGIARCLGTCCPVRAHLARSRLMVAVGLEPSSFSSYESRIFSHAG